MDPASKIDQEPLILCPRGGSAAACVLIIQPYRQYALSPRAAKHRLCRLDAVQDFCSLLEGKVADPLLLLHCISSIAELPQARRCLISSGAVPLLE